MKSMETEISNKSIIFLFLVLGAKMVVKFSTFVLWSIQREENEQLQNLKYSEIQHSVSLDNTSNLNMIW